MEHHKDLMKVLLEGGADPNRTDNVGRTPLHYVAQAGCTEGVQLLLSKGVDPNIVNQWGIAPLHCAVGRGHEGVIQLLLNAGADPNIPNGDDYGRTPLHYAVAKGHKHIVQLLKDAGANPNIADELGWTPLMRAQERFQDGFDLRGDLDYTEIVSILKSCPN